MKITVRFPDGKDHECHVLLGPYRAPVTVGPPPNADPPQQPVAEERNCVQVKAPDGVGYDQALAFQTSDGNWDFFKPFWS